jgi:hypothetical protein
MEKAVIGEKETTIDLFNNPVGYRTSLAKSSAFCCFKRLLFKN